MATLDDLTRQSIEQLLAGGPDALEQQLFDRSRMDIERQGQGLLENLFGRGFGRSTQTGPVGRQIAEALSKARTDAAVAARQATIAALAQASGQQQRQQQESQFERTLNFNNKNADRQEAIANRQLLAQGVGGIGGGALTLGGLIYGPEIKRGLKGLLGGGTPSPSALPSMPAAIGNEATQDYAIDVPTISAMDFDTSIPDFNLDVPEFDLSNALDPGNFSLDVSPLDFLAPTLDLLRVPDLDFEF